MDFETYYQGLFGPRWDALQQALQEPRGFAIRTNPFADPGDVPDAPLGTALPQLPAVRVSSAPFPPPPRDARGLVAWYALDPASVLVAHALGVAPGERVLDLCAAPGGKSCILAEGLGASGALVANDRSAARRARLQRVLAEWLPGERLAQVRVTGHDGTRWGMHEPEAYERILLDAPCSSERHVLADPRARRQWSPARSRQLAQRQYALLAAAVDALKPGGTLVYATCALVRDENDGVVERTLRSKKRGQGLSVKRVEAPFGEPTDHGTAILPDTTGFGPMWFTRLEKRGD